MEIKPITAKEIVESRFSIRTISIINDILDERFKVGEPVLITFEEFRARWDDYVGVYEKLIEKEYNNIDELYSLYGWTVIEGEEGMIFKMR
jgi:hypothetical protein